jgi:hypothetical protein|tara:strand:+ start:56 stop:409 length:354 start_codon:yes stop_codon:yes gene_type:complete
LTEFVNSSAETLEDGISKMFSAMIKDYGTFTPTDSEIRINMNEEYVDGLTFKRGSKYIKVISGDSVSSFIVATENDKKFKKGDILKPAGWAAPARNAPRGNVLDGGYPINWTGPLYL